MNIQGTSYPDILFGTPENDSIAGGGGDDVLFGTMYGNTIHDERDLRPLRSHPILGNADTGSDTLRGEAGNDVLFGGGGMDVLDGGVGDDTLAGDGGGDVLAGGPGRDVFRYHDGADSLPSNPDRIADFQQGEDRIDLSRLGGSPPGAVYNGQYGFSNATLIQVRFDWIGEDTRIQWSAPASGGAVVTPDSPGFSWDVPSAVVQGEIVVSGRFFPMPQDFVLTGDDPNLVEVRPGAVGTIRGPRYDYQPEKAEVVRMYDTVFSRLPDAPGEAFWVASLKAGSSLLDVADRFVQAPEFAATYGQPDNLAFVRLLYQNVLDRPGETDGETFWSTALDRGYATRSEVVVGFSESPEHVSLVNREMELLG